MFDISWPFELQLLICFVALMSAGFGNPIPEELMVIAAGVQTAKLVGLGPARWLMFPVCIAGAVMADVILYALGRYLGGSLMKGFIARIAPPQKQARIRHNFHRYGIAIFVIGRLVPGIRTTMFLTAGAMRLPLVRFLIADGVGALVGVGLFFFLGFGLGTQFLDVIESYEQKLMPYRAIALLVLFSAIAAYLAYLFFRHPIATGDPEEVPLIGHQLAVHMPHKDDAPPAPQVAVEREATSPEPTPQR